MHKSLKLTAITGIGAFAIAISLSGCTAGTVKFSCQGHNGVYASSNGVAVVENDDNCK